MKRTVLIALLLLPLAWLGGCSQPVEPGLETVEASAPSDEPSEPCQVDPPAEPVMCTMDWNPVCGCNGKTYSNACSAGAAGVTRFEPGECDKKDRL